MTAVALPAWERGRLDGAVRARGLLFGQMYEDPAIERAAFPRGGRVFAIASAGCTAMALASDHDVVAVDVNPRQVEYARARASGAASARGTVETLMAAVRAAGPLA
ncbi:MAG TPA: DUF3419 family protein, partial [Kofleriaceae bacterium]|nr:DUF3419 family protein [Kofleriaceae bacterium]